MIYEVVDPKTGSTTGFTNRIDADKYADRVESEVTELESPAAYDFTRTEED